MINLIIRINERMVFLLEKKEKFSLKIVVADVKTFDHFFKALGYVLKNPENLTFNQQRKLKRILKCKLKTTRAYLLKDSFRFLWTYTSPYWARWFLRKWYGTSRSKLLPFKSFAKSMRKHEGLILHTMEELPEPELTHGFC